MITKEKKSIKGKALALTVALSMAFSFSTFAQTQTRKQARAQKAQQEAQQPQQEAQQAQPTQSQNTQTDQPVKENFTEQELQQFVGVYKRASEIQQKNEGQMMQAIQQENMDVDRFKQILDAHQNQTNPTDINASTEEMASFNRAAEKIIKVQEEVQTEIAQMIDQEMGLQQYEQIVNAYQQSPTVQERLNKIMEAQMK